MITVSSVYASPSMAHARLRDSIPKFIPEGFRYIDYVWADTVIKERPDVIITHYGFSTYQPLMAFISPKAVITELTTPQIMSYFTDRDLAVVYDPAQRDSFLAAGINSILWPRPVETGIFYREDISKDIDVIIPSVHNTEIARIIVETCQELGKSCIVFSKDIRHPGTRDFCDGDTDKLRKYYNRAKYIFSLVPQCRYGLNNEYVTHGFEVGYIEGIFCGATPVVIDAPTGEYLKYWYGDYARWVREDHLREDIHALLSSEYTPLSDDLIQKAIQRFNAQDVWGQLFQAIKEILGR